MIDKRRGWGEFGIAGLLLVLGVVVFIDTRNTAVPATAGAAGPRFFPFGVSALLVVIGIWLAADILRKHRSDLARRRPVEYAVSPGDAVMDAAESGDSPDLEEAGVPTDWKAMGLVLAVMVLHIALMPITGYVVATFVLFWGTAFAFGSKRFPRDPIIALCVAVVVYVGFTEGLSIHLPAGIFEGVFRWMD